MVIWRALREGRQTDCPLLSCAVLGLPIFPAREPVHQRDDPQDERDPADEDKEERHRLSPAAKKNVTPISTNQAVTPPIAVATENGRSLRN